MEARLVLARRLHVVRFDVVRMLAVRLRQLDAADLPTGEKSRLTATLADALLGALVVDDLSKRTQALEAVLLSRKDSER